MGGERHGTGGPVLHAVYLDNTGTTKGMLVLSRNWVSRPYLGTRCILQ